MKKLQIILSVLTTAIAVSAASGAGLVNPSFETPAVGGSLLNIMTAPPGFGWSLVPGLNDVDIISGLWPASNGAQSMDMSGLNGPGAIYQDFFFSSAGTWEIKFDMSCNPLSSSLKVLRVDFGPSGGALTTLGTFSLAVGTRTLSNMQWVTQTTPTVTIPNASQSYRLEFTSLTADNSGPALDNVQLQLVPEPGSLALFGCALAGILCMRSKKVAGRV